MPFFPMVLKLRSMLNLILAPLILILARHMPFFPYGPEIEEYVEPDLTPLILTRSVYSFRTYDELVHCWRMLHLDHGKDVIHHSVY